MRRVPCLALVTLGLITAVRSVPAEITPAAQEVVDRYVEATGGRAALEAERGTHAFGRIETIKLKGTIEQWTQTPDKFAVRIRLGSLRLRTGTDGWSGWETDLASKHVRVLEGKDLERLQSEAWFQNEMWARDDQGGGRVSYVSTSFGGRRIFHCLDATPPVGAARRMWFDGKTGLITRMVARVDQNESVLFYSEYGSFGGRKRPTLQDGVDQSLAFLYEEAPVNADGSRVPGDPEGQAPGRFMAAMCRRITPSERTTRPAR